MATSSLVDRFGLRYPYSGLARIASENKSRGHSRSTTLVRPALNTACLLDRNSYGL
jgi:hypothetical protein